MNDGFWVGFFWADVVLLGANSLGPVRVWGANSIEECHYAR